MDENPTTVIGTHIETQKKLAQCAFNSCAGGDGRSDKLFSLRQKLGQKAKNALSTLAPQEPEFRFYALYDRIYWRKS